MANMKFWKIASKPPTQALKLIGAGRLKGRHDINPVWRMQIMTEHFGQCGEGWKYTIDRLWTEPGTDGQVCAFALVSVYTKEKDTSWSDPIPGIGGSMLIAKEKAGLYTSDEAFKMAVTDALSVAFKSLGVAAEIYLGNFDGSKYKEPERNEEETEQKMIGFLDLVNGFAEASDLIEWWNKNKEQVKGVIGQANAGRLYKQVIDKKKALENGTAN
jgi:hypothetical protein